MLQHRHKYPAQEAHHHKTKGYSSFIALLLVKLSSGGMDVQGFFIFILFFVHQFSSILFGSHSLISSKMVPFCRINLILKNQ